MTLGNFGQLDFGQAFQLDGKLYEKQSRYSARLLRTASGRSPAMSITRLIDPEVTVAIASNDIMSGSNKLPA